MLNFDIKIGDMVPEPPEPRTEKEIISGWDGDSKNPTLSILCITYNHEEYISKTLNGFLMQETDFKFEIIVHDDASEDGTQRIINEYKARYPKIFKAIFQKENQYSKGRRALSFLQGVSDAEYLAVCEGDDYWLDPQKLQKQVEFLQSNQDYVISGHNAMVIDEQGKLINHSKLPDIQKRDFDAAALTKSQAWILTMSWVYRNVIKEFAPERNMVKNGDVFLISLLGNHGKSHFHHEILPAVYRVHSGGVWSTLDKDARFDDDINTKFWMYRYYKRIGSNELALHYRKIFMRRVISQAPVGAFIAELFYRIMTLLGVKNLIFKAIDLTGMGNAQKLKKLFTKKM